MMVIQTSKTLEVLEMKMIAQQTSVSICFLSIFLQIERSLRSSGTTAGTTTSPTPIGGQLVSHMTFAGIWFHLQSLMETFVIYND